MKPSGSDPVTARSAVAGGVLAWARGALWTGLPFVALIVYLWLHRAGKVERVPAIAYERTLILDTLLLWAITAAIWAVVVERRGVGRWLSAQKAQIALLSVSLLISAAFAEVALRILRPDSRVRPFASLSSDLLHHVNAPNRSSPGMGGALVATNADGFRSPYSRDDFRAHGQRIVLLGDSYTFGLGVKQEESVGAVLESHLRQTGTDVAVLNTGVISYSPLLARQTLRKVARHYQPTLVLLLVDVNDIGDDHQYSREIVPGTEDDPRFDVPPAAGSAPGPCARSALCSTLGPVWERLFGIPSRVLANVMGWGREEYDYYAFEVEVGGRVETNRFFVLRHSLELTRPFFDRSWGYITDIAEESRALGADMALVVMPRYFHWNDAECPRNWEKDRYAVDEPHENAYLEYFDARAPAAGFPVWSLLPAFRSAEGPLVFDTDPHWNAAGHRVAGGALARMLLGAGWPGPISDAAPLFSFPGIVPGAGEASPGAVVPGAMEKPGPAGPAPAESEEKNHDP
ncbi:MAG: GDSL-type esterase/lipase family protein [Holophagales bacterium]|nr:GDSL-type esterase/lipase family protein [Holophagales bacterium]